MKRENAVWVAVAGLLTGFGASALAYHVGRKRREDAPMEPTYTIPYHPAPDKLNDVEKTLLEQALLRLAVTKAPLPAPDMQRAFDLAIKGELPRTAATLRSIMTDGKIGGPTYVPLPTNEAWPGTNIAVRTYVANELAKLQTQAAQA